MAKLVFNLSRQVFSSTHWNELKRLNQKSWSSLWAKKPGFDFGV